MTRKIILVDFDGTISNHDHRVHHCPDRMDLYHSDELVLKDEPNFELINAVRDEVQRTESWPVILTARRESMRVVTNQWLVRNNLDNLFREITMRPDKHVGGSTNFKFDLIRYYKMNPDLEVTSVYDDNEDLIDLCEGIGIKAYLSMDINLDIYDES